MTTNKLAGLEQTNECFRSDCFQFSLVLITNAMKHQIKAKLQVELEEEKDWPRFSYMKGSVCYKNKVCADPYVLNQGHNVMSAPANVVDSMLS